VVPSRLALFNCSTTLVFAIATQALIDDRGAGDGAAQPFELFALLSGRAFLMQAVQDVWDEAVSSDAPT